MLSILFSALALPLTHNIMLNGPVTLILSRETKSTLRLIFKIM